MNLLKEPDFYKPFYEGDILYTVYDNLHFQDITPEGGSRFCTFAVSGSAKVYNQKCELVAEGAGIVKEGKARVKDPAKKGSASSWESPNWWARPKHIYTDEDWDKIIAIWKNEKVRGPEPLYWDDVKIGEDPTPKAVGPIMVEQETGMLYTVPLWNVDLKKNILDTKTFLKMKKNEQGIYVMPDTPEKKPADDPSKLTGRADARYRDGRAVMQNAVCMKFAAGMIWDWIGEKGWLQRIGHQIMANPVPGYPEAAVPAITKNMMPNLFDKYPYMEKVLYMKGKNDRYSRALWPAMEGDLIICKSYVFDKYIKDNEYFVDLTWWCEAFDGDIVEEGTATVKLLKKV